MDKGQCQHYYVHDNGTIVPCPRPAVGVKEIPGTLPDELWVVMACVVHSCPPQLTPLVEGEHISPLKAVNTLPV